MEDLKQFINVLSDPKIVFPSLLGVFVFVFPPTDRLYSLNKRLRVDKLWTNAGGVFIFVMLLAFFLFGLTDVNFRLIVTKPDNVPIVGLIFLVTFFLWLSMKQARENDRRLAEGKKPNEAADKEPVLVWPDLVYVEFIATIVCTILLIVWSISLSAPLEQAANPAVSPNPSKAPWYFLGLQEMLVYFDPWLAGVVFPGVITVGIMAIPYLDNNKKGSGYYSFADRKMAVSVFMFFWLILWVFLIVVGTFLRGPNWNFFGPFEVWTVSKLEALTNVNLSELVYMKFLGRRLPDSILIREMWGFLALGGYFCVLPLVLMKTLFRKLHQDLGNVRFSFFTIMLLMSFSLPIKMMLRWAFNIKYIVAIPEYFFNI